MSADMGIFVSTVFMFFESPKVSVNSYARGLDVEVDIKRNRLMFSS